jgi:hypothetical protein
LDDVLLSAQGVAYASDCLERLKERVASSSLDSALKTVASRLSYVKSEPIIVTIKGERKFFLMEPLAEGSFFKLRSNRHDGAGFLCRKQPESDCWTASILEQIRMVTPAQTCIRLAFKAYINKLTFNFGALDPCVGEFYKSHREKVRKNGQDPDIIIS